MVLVPAVVLAQRVRVVLVRVAPAVRVAVAVPAVMPVVVAAVVVPDMPAFIRLFFLCTAVAVAVAVASVALVAPPVREHPVGASILRVMPVP